MQRTEATDWPRMGSEATRSEFEAFYREHQDTILRLALAITGERDSAADAAQEAFLKVLDRWKRIRAMEQPQGFLRRTAVRCAIDVLRERRRNQEFVRGTSDGINPEEIAVRQTLAELHPDQQAILALSIGQGWSYAEIAEGLDIPAGTVASRIHAAKEAFRKQWGDER